MSILIYIQCINWCSTVAKKYLMQIYKFTKQCVYFYVVFIFINCCTYQRTLRNYERQNEESSYDWTELLAIQWCCIYYPMDRHGGKLSKLTIASVWLAVGLMLILLILSRPSVNNKKSSQLIRPRGIWTKFQIRNFQNNFSDWWLRYSL